MSDLSAEQFVEALLSEEAHAQPSDRAKESELVMQLPPWFDEEQFNRGRKFFDNFCFSFASSMLMGLVAVFSVPSILRILVSTRRSNSVFTAYRRYLSTLLHTISWFEHELKPGSTSWRSLYTVRTRHLRAGLAAKSKGLGTVSQRDMALTQFGFIGFSFLKPEAFGIRQLRDGDWEAFNHFWRVIVYMIGLDDRYNICRKTADETRKVCQLLQDRVFTPCLENVPEYFEHSARVMLDGMWSVNPTVDVDSSLWWCKYLADVPGYIYSEKDRIRFQSRLREQLEGKPLDTGVPSSSLMAKPALEGLPDVPPRLHYYKDYSSLESSPAYQTLTIKNKYKLYINNLYMYLYGCGFGRWYFNINFKFSLYLMRYFPYVAFFRFGIKKSLTNIFEEDPIDDTKPKLNSEYTKKKANVPWYEWLYVLFW